MIFPKIPNFEMKAKWFLLLNHLVKKLEKLKNFEDVNLIQMLNSDYWYQIKSIITHLIDNVVGYEKIFSRTPEINNKSNLNNLMESIFAEVQAAAYLVFRKFKNIRYIGTEKKGSFDFIATREGKSYAIEVKYRTSKIIDGVHMIESKRHVTKLLSAYREAEKQIDKRNCNELNPIVIIVYPAIELFPELLQHDSHNGKHPIQSFVDNCKIPTVVLPVGYETRGTFGDEVFDKSEFANFCYRTGLPQISEKPLQV